VFCYPINQNKESIAYYVKSLDAGCSMTLLGIIDVTDEVHSVKLTKLDSHSSSGRRRGISQHAPPFNQSQRCGCPPSWP